MAIGRLVVGGLIQGVQGWSYGITLDIGNSGTGADAQAFAVQAYTDFLTSAWNTTSPGAVALKSLMTSGDQVTGVRFYDYPALGSPARVVGASTAGSQAGTGSNYQAPQVAVVASLLTGLAGRSNRGRIYIPYTGGQVNATLRLSTTPSAIATTVANWLSLLRTRTYAGSPVTPIVASATGSRPQIQTVRVDNVLDTQRRRRDKILSTNTGSAALIVP